MIDSARSWTMGKNRPMTNYAVSWRVAYHGTGGTSMFAAASPTAAENHMRDRAALKVFGSLEATVDIIITGVAPHPPPYRHDPYRFRSCR